jgi:hypothetical protein
MVEALEHELCIDWTNNEEFNASAEKMHDAIQAGNQAIAQLESQELVAWNRGVPPVRPQQKEGETFIVSYEDTNPPQRTEQEPDAWRIKVETKLRDGSVDVGYQLRNEKFSVYDEPLYTHPPQRTWVGLTDDEHCDIWYKESLDWMEYGKAIEAKIKEKNT